MALPAGELVMVYTAPAEPAPPDWLDANAAATGARQPAFRIIRLPRAPDRQCDLDRHVEAPRGGVSPASGDLCQVFTPHGRGGRGGRSGVVPVPSRPPFRPAPRVRA